MTQWQAASAAIGSPSSRSCRWQGQLTPPTIPLWHQGQRNRVGPATRAFRTPRNARTAHRTPTATTVEPVGAPYRGCRRSLDGALASSSPPGAGRDEVAARISAQVQALVADRASWLNLPARRPRQPAGDQEHPCRASLPHHAVRSSTATEDNLALDVRGSPGKTAVRMALSRRLLIRMKSEVQVLPGPLPALTTRNAGCLVRRPSGRGVFGIKSSYLVTVPCRGSALLSSDDFGSSVGRRGGCHSVYARRTRDLVSGSQGGWKSPVGWGPPRRLVTPRLSAREALPGARARHPSTASS
jgi:hypothetical protein